MEKENSQSQGAFKMNYNGQEVTGEQAKELAQQLFQKVIPGLTTSFGSIFNTVKQSISGDSIPAKIVNGITNMPGVKDSMPSFELSKDFSKFKVTMNGETLVDFDLAEVLSQSNKDDSSKNS